MKTGKNGEKGFRAAWKALRRSKSVIVLLVYFAFWVIVAPYLNVQDFIIPAPLKIIDALVEIWPKILQHGRLTLMEASLGLFMGTMFGAALSILFFFAPVLEELILPLVLVIRSLPYVAIAPILWITIGGGSASIVLLVSLVSFWAVTITFSEGLHAADKELQDLFKIMNASRLQEFIKLRLPYSLPFLCKGIEVSAGGAFVVAIVAEAIVSNVGLGYLLVMYKYNYMTANLYAVMIVSAICCLAFVAIARVFQKIITPWERRGSRGE